VRADPVLVLAGLALAHLVADFILQTDAMAADKRASGRRAWRALLIHAAAVAVCLAPFGVVFGAPGLAVLVVVAASHVAIDRWKVLATRRAEARALAAAHARHVHDDTDPTTLGPTWTPTPAALFALDQLLHGVVLVVAWTVWLDGAPVLPPVGDAAGRVTGAWDLALLHRVAVGAVVLASLAIVNIRAGALFVATLVHPREVVTGIPLRDEPAHPPPAPRSPWRLRMGPIVAVAAPIDAVVLAPARTGGRNAADAAPGRSSGSGHASPARVGATIGILERLLIVTLVLTNATAAIGLVVAAKTLARFRQLDDRDFAEYYLLGTLASVGVALGSALVGLGALKAAGF
jgi:hypothetical protein